MKCKKVKSGVLILLCIGLIELQAQEVIPVSGGNASGSGGFVSYSIGQVVYTTITGTNGYSAQGAQQPYEISAITGIQEALDISIEIVVSPNPATDFLKLKIENYEVGNLRYQLYDINGNLIFSNKVEDNETSIVMNNLLPSTYFLKITDRNKLIKIFKVIKH